MTVINSGRLGGSKHEYVEDFFHDAHRNWQQILNILVFVSRRIKCTVPPLIAFLGNIGKPCIRCAYIFVQRWVGAHG